MEVPIELIRASPYQPRLTFDLEDIRGSIQKDGILVSLTVRKKDGYYELIDGERRLRLAKELGYKTVKCDIVDVSDEVARRMVWKVNTLRKDYTPKEKAYHFKKLQDKYGMSIRAIALDCDERWSTVKAAFNVLKLKEITGTDKYEKLVWAKHKLSLGHIEEIQDLFNTSSTDVERIVSWLEQTIEQKLTTDELRKARKPELEEAEHQRVESAKKAVGKITTEVKEPESPEELEKAAEALKEEANKRRTAQEILEKKREKAKKSLGSAIKKLDNARELKLDITDFETEVKGIRQIVEENPEEAWDRAKAVKKKLNKVIKVEKTRRKEARIEFRMRQEDITARLNKANELRITTKNFNLRNKEIKVKVRQNPYQALEEAKELLNNINEAIQIEERRLLEEESRKKAKEELLRDPSVILRAKAIKARAKRLKEREAERAKGLELGEKAKDALDSRLVLIKASVEEMVTAIEESSVDVIITDPPYSKEYLDCFSSLARFAFKVLKPCKSLLVMVGQSYLPEVFRLLCEQMSYHWSLAYLTPGGQSPQIWPRKINTFWKPVIWLTKGKYEGKEWHGDVFSSDVNDNDKRFHHWGQSESGISRLVEAFSKPDDVVCDPFLGGGTTALVATRLGRRFIGSDIDENALETCKRRVVQSYE